MHTPTTRPPHNRRTSQAPVAAHGAPGRPAQRPRHGATSVLRQRGLTLIEVLVALLLGLLLIGAVGGLYLANHQTFRQVENMARVNENARLAFELLGRDLREAGGMRCGQHLPAANAASNPAETWWNQWDQGLRGYHEQDPNIPADPLPARAFGQTPLDRVPSTDAVVVNLSQHDPAGGLPACNLLFHAWYIGFNGRGGTSLYRVTMVNNAGNAQVGAPEEIIENVTDLQLSYLVRPSGDDAVDDRYIRAARVNQWGLAQVPPANGWSLVRAVRLELTFTTAEAVGTDAAVPITRTLPFVVGLRNRLP